MRKFYLLIIMVMTKSQTSEVNLFNPACQLNKLLLILTLNIYTYI